MERAGGRRLADALTELGGGQRAAEDQLLEQRDPHRMSERPHGARIGHLPQLFPRRRTRRWLTCSRVINSHVSIVSSQQISVKRILSREHSLDNGSGLPGSASFVSSAT